MLEFIDRTLLPFFLSLYDGIGYLGVGIAIALETFIPIIPSELIVPMAGWKVSQSAADPSVLEPLTQMGWNWAIALGVATIGAVAGSLAGYLIGAWGGRPLLDRYGRFVHIRAEDLDRADAWFARYGDRAVFFARLVPLLRALINYPAGVARMPVGRFVFFSALGSLPWNAALLLGGYLLGENYRRLYEALQPFEFVIYAVVVAGTVYVIYRWLRGRGGSENVGPRVGRDLSSNERALLDWLLRDPQVPDAHTLRAQIPFAQVVRGIPAMPTYLHLAVSGAPPAACNDGPLPGSAVVMSTSGEATGFLLLWVKNGYLNSVEHAWVTDQMPREFPTPQQLRAFRPDEVHPERQPN